MRPFSRLLLALLLSWAPAIARAQDVPAADHHQHLFSEALARLVSPPSPAPPISVITAADLIRHLDAAGITRAVVLSTAYIWSQPSRNIENVYERVRADNDWTGEQVAQFPSRLVGFCAVNPLKDWALSELQRCSKNPNLRRGLKLHFGNSAVDFQNPQHVEQVRRMFGAANALGMPIVVHMRASITEKLAYGRDAALMFLNEILPAAPDVMVQIAHLAGAGGYADPLVDDVVGVFIEAIGRRDERTDRLWFDVTGVALGNPAPDRLQLIAARIRQLGLQRILYGSDAPVTNNLPRDGWAAFRRLPLTASEFQTIARNVPPYLRE